MRRITPYLFICFSVLVLQFSVVSSGWAVNFTFTKIVDTNTPIPGGSGNFTDFAYWAYDGATLAFNAEGLPTPSLPSGQRGVYTITGEASPSLIADRNTPRPGSVENFAGFASVYIQNGQVTFTAVPAQGSGGPLGIYSNFGGSLNVVADINTPVPGGSGNFTSFGTAVLRCAAASPHSGGSASKVTKAPTRTSGGNSPQSWTPKHQSPVALVPSKAQLLYYFAVPTLFSPPATIVTTRHTLVRISQTYIETGGQIQPIVDANTRVPSGNDTTQNNGKKYKFIRSSPIGFLNTGDLVFFGQDVVGSHGIYTIDSNGKVRTLFNNLKTVCLPTGGTLGGIKFGGGCWRQ